MNEQKLNAEKRAESSEKLSMQNGVAPMIKTTNITKWYPSGFGKIFVGQIIARHIDGNIGYPYISHWSFLFVSLSLIFDIT